MQPHSPILKALAKLYCGAQSGRTGQAERGFSQDYRKLLKAAGCLDGEPLAQAENDLREAERLSQRSLEIVTPKRDTTLIERIVLHRDGGEAWLFGYLGEPSPTQKRDDLADLFKVFAQEPAPTLWQAAWETWCQTLAANACHGRSVKPFSRDDLDGSRELLTLLIKLLHWQGESLIRFASCLLCGDSKHLEKHQANLETCLRQISNSRITKFEDIGLLEEPRQVWVHGALRLNFPEGDLHTAWLHGPVALSERDLQRATAIHCDASRLLTVENKATFLELSKKRDDVLLVQTSYPGSATLTLLARLSGSLPCWHFGDSDPAGFDILRDLRARTGRRFQPLHMGYRPAPTVVENWLTEKDQSLLKRLLADRQMEDCHMELLKLLSTGNRGLYEQEMLGLPPLPSWPYYPTEG